MADYDYVFDLKIDGDGYGQSTAESCWYASYAILFDWKGTPRSSIRERIEKAGLDYADYYRNGLPQEDFSKTRGALGLVGWRGSYIKEIASDFQALYVLLKGYGPIWCAFSKPSAHIVVIVGVDSIAGNIHILNPWNNSNGNNADSQYMKPSTFALRLNTDVQSVGQAFM